MYPQEYVRGERYFLNHTYKVNPHVLIPRFETEVLVIESLKRLKGIESPQIIEMGTGSGIISVELAKALPQAQVVATDVSLEAIHVARENAIQILGPLNRQIHFVQNLNPEFALRGVIASSVRADLIISNPPYLDFSEDDIAEDVLAFEPPQALTAPSVDSVFFYRRIMEEASEYLKPGGFVALEIPHERADLIESIFAQNGWIVEILRDLTDRPRVLVGRKEPIGNDSGQT